MFSKKVYLDRLDTLPDGVIPIARSEAKTIISRTKWLSTSMVLAHATRAIDRLLPFIPPSRPTYIVYQSVKIGSMQWLSIELYDRIKKVLPNAILIDEYLLEDGPAPRNLIFIDDCSVSGTRVGDHQIREYPNDFLYIALSYISEAALRYIRSVLTRKVWISIGSGIRILSTDTTGKRHAYLLEYGLPDRYVIYPELYTKLGYRPDVSILSNNLDKLKRIDERLYWFSLYKQMLTNLNQPVRLSLAAPSYQDTRPAGITRFSAHYRNLVAESKPRNAVVHKRAHLT